MVAMAIRKGEDGKCEVVGQGYLCHQKAVS